MKLALALAALTVTLAASVHDASACGMSVRLDPTPAKPSPVQEIAKAEKALESGQNVDAAKTVLATYPRIRVATAGSNPLETRALRVFALSLVRSDGTADEKKAHMPATGEWLPKSNIAWAVQALKEIDTARPNDPTVQADLGEALAKTPEGQKEAMTKLAALAEKDLMGSPHAYAALAKMKETAGDTSGAQAAIKRCEEMTKTPGVCKVAKA